MTRVCILDYGSGNVGSVYHLLSSICDDVEISNDAKSIAGATHIVLPGVGAFASAMEKISTAVPIEALRTAVLEAKTPFLGICVGMQVLAEVGHEFGEAKGIGWVEGSVELLEAGDHPLPHIGWNNVDVVKENPLFHGIPNGTDFYFVHSYAFQPAQDDVVIATSDYGGPFCCSVRKDNLFGVQFHPEKSQKAGKQLLRNFLQVESGGAA